MEIESLLNSNTLNNPMIFGVLFIWLFLKNINNSNTREESLKKLIGEQQELIRKQSTVIEEQQKLIKEQNKINNELSKVIQTAIIEIHKKIDILISENEKRSEVA